MTRFQILLIISIFATYLPKILQAFVSFLKTIKKSRTNETPSKVHPSRRPPSSISLGGTLNWECIKKLLAVALTTTPVRYTV